MVGNEVFETTVYQWFRMGGIAYITDDAANKQGKIMGKSPIFTSKRVRETTGEKSKKTSGAEIGRFYVC